MTSVHASNGNRFKVHACPICKRDDMLEMNEDNAGWVTVYHVDCRICKIQTKPHSDPNSSVEAWNNLERN